MLGVVAGILYLVVVLFVLLMLVRLVLDWVQVLARDWRPRGIAAVAAEITYTVTDPPVRAVRRVVPPLTIGSFRIDLAFIIVLLLCSFLMNGLLYLA